MADRDTILRMAREIHIAKIKSCYFNTKISEGHWSTVEAALGREPFPEIGTKEQRELMHREAPWVEIAVDQAKAVARLLNL